jgi:hypothetical protein
MSGEASSDRAQESHSRADEEPTCSARDCRRPASFDLQWNNPKIHTPERRKHWLACGDHRESLSAFLSARGFLREVESVSGAGTP